MNSLDPRVRRLVANGPPLAGEPKTPMDQFGTFEVFVQPKEGKPFQHEGIVHAPNLEMAYVLAKEAFTRRFVCVSLYVVATGDVSVSPMTEGDMNAYQQIEVDPQPRKEPVAYEIYHLTRRGKQHVHAGTVRAGDAMEAMAEAKRTFQSEKSICNVWAVRSENIRFTLPGDDDLWTTLPEKKFRDAAAYKGGEKLKLFLEARKNSPS